MKILESDSPRIENFPWNLIVKNLINSVFILENFLISSSTKKFELKNSEWLVLKTEYSLILESTKDGMKLKNYK